MKFARQLRMLCWKNFTTRKRKKIRFFVELVWPVFLALMICLLRYFSHRDHKTECHFASNALPSAGMLPFLQTLVCNTQNHCYENSLRGEMSGEISDFQDAGISKIFRDISELLSNETFAEDWVAITNDLNELQKSYTLLQKTPEMEGFGNLSSILRDPDDFRVYLMYNKLVPGDVADSVLGANVDSKFVQSLLSGMKIPPEECFGKVDIALVGQDDLLVKSTQQEFCERLGDGDYMDISRELQRDVDPLSFIEVVKTTSTSSPVNAPTLAELLSNASDMRAYMTNEMQLSDTSADIMLDQQVSPKELKLLFSGHDMKDTVCNVSALLTYFPSASYEQTYELSSSLCVLTDQQLDDFSEELKSSMNKTALVDYVSSSNSTNVLEEQISSQYDQLMKDIQALEGYNNLLADISQQNFSDTSKFLCGELTGTIFEALKNSNGSGNAGSSFSSGGAKGFAGGGNQGNSKPSEVSECEWINELQSQSGGEAIWSKIKPIVQGYILYYPDTVATRKIIDKAKEMLDTVKTVEDVAEKWLEYSPTIHAALDQNSGFGDCEDDIESVLNFVKEMTNANDSQVPSLDVINLDDYRELVDAMDNMSMEIIEILKCVELDKFIGFSDENELLETAHIMADNNTFWGAINFTSLIEEHNIPKYIDYKIRMLSDVLESTHKLTDRFWQPKPRLRSKYIDSGFIYIQDMVESAILQVQTGLNMTQIGVWYHQFPYPCYVEDNFLLILDGMLPLLMTLAWVFSVAMIIKSIVFEKERRLKEVMKVMGLENGVHWTAWFIDSIIMMTLSSILLVLIFKYGNITIASDPFVLLFFLLSFSVSTIMLCFLISVLFSKANLAAACGAVFYFLTYIPYVMVYVRDDRISLTVKVLVSLLNTIAFGYGSRYLALFEIQGDGAQWWNINTSPLNGDTNMTFLQVIGMMWLDAFIYGILTWYIEAVHPGHYGIPRPFYFPFTRSYWCGYRPRQNQDNMELNQCGFDPHDALNANFEEDPTQFTCGVSINGLVKVYKTGKKLAVDNLNMKFYENQITSFLGHNGAGKTTTMSILTGLFPPTSGNAFIYGKSILTDIDEIRKSLGMCPQHNVLFDNLTVAEHLWFFARLKGLPSSKVKAEMEKMLKDLQIPHKRDELPSALSGGMKRKLSIAIAFLGEAKCVILDEPTAGVDPYSRREIWDLLNKYRKGRTVIMSTHHMDEADVLGDRIAIIANGKLKCCGSSLFLKGRYGSGYYLVLTKETTSMQLRGDYTTLDDPVRKSASGIEIEDVGYCSEAIVTGFIQRFVPGAEVCENIGQEISYLLPFGAIRGGGFQKLFANLEENAERLHIKSFGISDTSLEEVFLTVAEESAEFRVGDIDLATDSGALPRPWMGRGSLRRRGYQLPNLQTMDREDVGLLQSDYADANHQHQEVPIRSEDDKDSALGDETPDEERNSRETAHQEEAGKSMMIEEQSKLDQIYKC